MITLITFLVQNWLLVASLTFVIFGSLFLFRNRIGFVYLGLRKIISLLWQFLVREIEKFKALSPEKKWFFTKWAFVLVAIVFLAYKFGYLLLPPKITTSFPDNLGEEIPLDAKIEIIFNRGVIKPLVEKSFKINPEVLGKFVWEGDQKLIFVPQGNLQRAGNYQISFKGLVLSNFLIPMIGQKEISFFTIGYPKVILASPQDELLEDLSPITVIFDRPMIVLTTAENSALKKEAFKISPAVKGISRWLGTTAYQFRPSEPYKKATTYQVIVPAGLLSVDGGTLANDFKWQFSSLRPRIDEINPGHDDRFASPLASISAVFNQEMTAQTFTDRFLVYDNNNQQVSGRIETIGKIVGFHPINQLKREANYRVVIKEGVQSVNGPNGLPADYSWSFKTTPLPAVISTKPQNGDKNISEEHRIEITFKSPMDEDSFKDKVILEPKPEIKPDIYFYSDNKENKLYINTYLKRSQKYTISISGDVKDQYGIPLGQPFIFSFTTAPYKPSVSISPFGTYFAAFNQEIVPRIVVLATNTNKVDYWLYKLKKDDLLELYRRRYQDICGDDQQCRNWQNYDTSKLEKVNAWSEAYQPEDEIPVNVVTKITLPNGYKIPAGFYFLEAKIPQGAHDNMVMIVSHSALTVKKSDHQLLVWVINQSTGEVIDNMNLQLMTSSGDILSEGKTNKDGVLMKDVDLLDKNNLFVFGGKGNDLVVASSSWNNGIDRYDFGLPSYYNSNEQRDYDVQQKYKIFITTDRPIYRPKQKIYFKGLIRKDNDGAYEKISSGEKIKVSLKDARDRLIYDQDLPLTTFGSFSSDFSLSQDANLGYYRLQAEYDGNSFTQSLQVEEYRKPDLAVEVKPVKDAYINGEKAQININAAYYYGAPVANAEVNWVLTAQDFNFRYDKDWRFEFGDPDAYWGRWWSYNEQDNTTGESLTEGKGKTNNKGDLLINLPLNIDKEITSQRLIIEATVNDLNNQSIAASKEFTVHKAGLYVGLRPQSYANQSGKEAKVEVVVVDLNGKEVANTKVTLLFNKRTWETIREKNPDDGLFYYTTKATDTLVKETSVTTDALGRAVASFIPPAGGTYKIVAKVTDKNNNQNQSGSFLWVSGLGFSTIRENHDRIILVTDKRDYLVGEKADVFVASPFATASAKTLLTIERGSILDYQIVDTNENSNNFPIKISPKYAPNVFIGAVLVKPGTQIKSPPEFKIGYTEIKVTDKKQQVDVIVTTDKKKYQPKETLKATIETKNRLGQPVATELAVGLVDKAVWDLASLELPDIYKTFYQPRNLAVDTSQLLTISMDRINANTDLGTKGGSGGCFTGETKILLKAGLEKAIKKIKVGEIILTKENEQSIKLVEAKVTKVYQHLVNDYLIVNGELRVTTIHRLYVNGQWRVAGEISVGDYLLNKDNQLVRVFSVERVTGGKYQVYNLEIEKYKTFFAGNFYVHNQKAGGGRETVRQDFLDTAFWQPHLKTDINGKAFVSIKLPDNLTTWRLAAIANSAEAAVGSAVSEVVVSRDLLIRPFLPRFLSVGDEAKLGAIIVNNTGESQKLIVKIEAGGLIINESPVKQQVLSDGGQAKVTWLTKTKNAKTAKIKLTVSTENKVIQDAMEMILPIKSFSFPETVAVAGEVKNSAIEKIILPKEIDTTQGKATIDLSPSLGSSSFQGLSYLLSYPYYCSEQLTSRLLPAVFVHRILTNAKIERSGAIEVNQLKTVINETIQRLNNSQKPDGGWGWWPEYQSDPFITAYIYSALKEARSDDFIVADMTLQRARELLKYRLSYLNQEVSPDLRAYIAYVLRNDKISLISYASNLFERRFELSYQSRAYLAIVLKDLPNMRGKANQLLGELISLAKKTASATHWEDPKRDYYFNNSTATTATILEALTVFNKKNPLIPEVVRYLMSIRNDGHWSSTLDTALVIKAISKQLLAKQETILSENYRLSLNGKIIKESQFTKKDLLKLEEYLISINEFKIGSENKLQIDKSGQGSLYYNLNLNYYLPFSEIKPLEQGMVVVREFVDSEGKLLPKDTLLENTEVWVRLIIVTPEERHYVVIEDVLPAGLEPVNESLKNVSVLNQKPPKKQEKTNQSLYFGHKEYHDDRVSLFTDYLSPGVYEMTYRVRATTPGRYHQPPAQAYQMYLPDVSGHSDGGWLEIKE